MRYETIQELMDKAREAEGKTFGEIDTTGRIKNVRSKGALGHIIEESHFGYPINSDARPDFEELGIELKVTPFKKNKNGTYSSKERLVLNMIDYHNEHGYSFETSSFLSKATSMLIMLYQYESDIPIDDYRIYKAFLNEFSEEDLDVMRQDWETIVAKIKRGEAHLISEADTMYLSACTKGANGSVVRSQPFSEQPAKPRAFSLKASYMSGLVRQYLTPELMESIASHGELKEMSLEQLLEARLSPHYGKTVLELCEETGIRYNPGNKAMIPRVMARLLGVRGTDLSSIEEFAKAGIKFKTVGREPNRSIREHMSFGKVDFDDLHRDEWEESALYDTFAEQKYLLLVFRYDEEYVSKQKRIPRFEGIRLWNMPLETVDRELKSMWLETKNIVQAGVQLTPMKRGVKNNLPGPKFNRVAHVRSKALNGKDKVRLPDGQWITKQSFWLDRNYIQQILDA
ncbi:restriction endonuclease [Exiguobacterium sp. SH1S21]|uniref:Sau3AI family type II restriction endonuclease n=1 Tax=Exiguobacterium sp. SH1S21 TaxID=2510953 RepID=UPI00103C5A40|nr:Sau3AI family type II restriction endonuclease [Exiguobacterium sp. SH1S21]TCI52990.1 restriction endonuclease [Exiguobacterium sp. SH1S21]